MTGVQTCALPIYQDINYGYKIWRQTKGKTDYTVLSDTITINAGTYVNTIVEFGLVHIIVRYHK